MIGDMSVGSAVGLPSLARPGPDSHFGCGGHIPPKRRWISCRFVALIHLHPARIPHAVCFVSCDKNMQRSSLKAQEL